MSARRSLPITFRVNRTLDKTVAPRQSEISSCRAALTRIGAERIALSGEGRVAGNPGGDHEQGGDGAPDGIGAAASHWPARGRGGKSRA